MRRLNLVLLASLQLCQARQPTFSVHEDLLAHPQFEVVFSDEFISEADALAILESPPTHTAEPGLSKVRESAPAEISASKSGSGTSTSDNGEEEDDDDAPIAETYELINHDPWRYLCSVPVIAPPPTLNRTATELAKAEEARELTRASAKGWELMSGLDGQCLYFMSGWWSYSFCYDDTVVQYHAIAGAKPGEPPVRDETTPEYVLGKVQHKTWRSKRGTGDDDAEADGQTKSLAPPDAQLQIKGDQRYLSQRLESGTICDLTGRPRTIEIQYHCSPSATGDRIGWVKEVTTCTYMMVVYTPRLCTDVAFQPPKPTRAHPIRCRQIISNEEEELAWRYNKLIATGDLLSQKPKSAKPAGKELPPNHFAGLTVGGVVVGSKKHVRDAHADKLPLPRTGARNLVGPVMKILASRKPGSPKVDLLSDAELEKLDLDPKLVKDGVEEMESVAGDRGWSLQYVKDGDEVEYYGVFDGEEEDLYGGLEPMEGEEGGRNKGQGRTADAEEGQEGEWQEEYQEGSQEEFFKEEL
ncbi:glucosidase II beta subunit-like protein-domain-containing protein [Dichotomopilus funicola]|uniref:Endoplasmic reticulum lectin n=1 Tax=Dichotomopilus funicola TaxID=1934379 RepID=A0AAN6UZ10_9PEZI|nr:glucosidase II beta subunit-like protein-domain-containing protein [Dichotomopilus funicola]